MNVTVLARVRVLVWAVLSAMCVSTHGAQDDVNGLNHTLMAADVAAALRESNVFSVDGDYRTRFEHKYFNPKGEGEPETWESLGVALREEVEHIICGTMLRKTHRNDQEKYERIGIWRDGAWVQRVTGEEHNVAITGAVSPGDLHKQGFAFNLTEGRIPSWNTLAEVVEAGTLISSIVDHENVLTYRFAVGDAPDQLVQHELRMDLNKTPRLLACSTEIFDEDSSLIGLQTYTVRQWEQYDDVLLPEIMMLDIWRRDSPNPKVGSPLIARAVYTRLEFEAMSSPCSEMEELFTSSYPVGTRVHDGRMNISYEIGDSYLYMDGVMYTLAEPLMAPPGDRLDELLESARAQPAVPQGRLDGSGGLTRTKLMTLGFAASLGLVGALIVGRSVLKRRHVEGM